MDWIQDRQNPQRLLCMTGAAGAGKSALQQTIAERCQNGGILACTYFLSADDPTRNTTRTLVATIAYQIGLCNPALRKIIRTAVEDDPLVFSRSLKAQMTALIVDPVQRLRNTGFDVETLPYAILIDGLDECKGEDCQGEVLAVIKESLLDTNTPFRIFIASRPEWAIRTALERDGDLHEVAYHIQLSDKYDATADIRRYLWRKLRDIGSRSRDPRAKSSSWLTEEHIETLVRAASGQFIYAATVVKYVSERRTSPVDRLRTVLTWTPDQAHTARPFEKLDILYSNILRAAKDAYEAIDTNSGRDFLLLFRAHHHNATRGLAERHCPLQMGRIYSIKDYDRRILNLEEGTVDILISDLRSLVTVDDTRRITELRIYHRSFSDFLCSESRAKDLFVSESRILTLIVKSHLRHITQCPYNPNIFSGPPTGPSPPCEFLILRVLISEFGHNELDFYDDIVDFTKNNGWRELKATWDAILDSGADTIEVQQWMNRLALENLGITGFGHHFGALSSPDTNIKPEIMEVFESFEPPQKSSLISRIFFFLGPMLPILLNLPTQNTLIMRNIKYSMKKIADDLLERTKREMMMDAGDEKVGGSDKSIIGLLIKAESSSGGLTMTPGEVLAQNTLFFAGYETTSTSLTWALIEVSRHSEVQERLREELNQIGGDPTWEQITLGLPYLDAVTQEVLRMHTPVDNLLRETQQDDVVPLSKPIHTSSGELVSELVIAKGQAIHIPLVLINNSEEIWGPDFKEFKPERWLDPETTLTGDAKAIQGHHHIMSFSDGPRFCLGRHFALANFKVSHVLTYVDVDELANDFLFI
ncbi:hypothetical protein EST38_g10517 [Candolleomyces aberdarensis]|uniref:Nephrocystin 3-like N-terminal domain-containing protein n=1 Tax=Candolleomyces aberdarensis TaxID=2316362 RepID=A0A4Q2D8S5_9AGAR|nr:hypothetical protein EST38_g10517 [Candolleomyces aberdarensis]